MTRRVRLGLIGMLGVVLLQGTACSKGGERAPRAIAPARHLPRRHRRGRGPPRRTPRRLPAKPEPPATLTDVNLVAADMGGAVEELTGFYGPG